MKRHCDICKKKILKYISPNQKSVYCSRTCFNLHRSYEDYFEAKAVLDKLDKDFIIWFTGFWEGEGSLCQEKNTKSKCRFFTFGLAQTGNITYTFKNLFMFGKVNKSLKGKCKQWLFCGAGRIYAFIKVMNPHIRIEKRKAQIKKFLSDKYVKNFIRLLKTNGEL